MQEKIMEILQSVRPDIDFAKEQALIDDGLLESFDVIQIMTTFMDEFDVYIDADDIEPENLNSFDAICAFLTQKIGS
ncbi:MAG: acyl carrier protein [Lachnospiraceae bacterium]|nr:acyl carrier protein [Lachnospiraceae bacterium]